MAETHHLGNAVGIISVGLDRARRQEPSSMANLDTHDWDARLAKPTVQPFRQRTGLNTGEIDDAGPFRQARDERSRLARHLTLPQHHAVAVDHTRCRLAERHIKPEKHTHDGLLVNRLIRLNSRAVESGSDYPSSPPLTDNGPVPWFVSVGVQRRRVRPTSR
jgi:hypothetical protein